MTSHSAAAVLLDTNMSPPPNDSESAFVKDNAKFFEDVLEKALVPKIFHDPALSTAEKTLLSEHRAGTPPHKMCARTYYTMKERLEAKGGLDGPDAVARLESVFASQMMMARVRWFWRPLSKASSLWIVLRTWKSRLVWLHCAWVHRTRRCPILDPPSTPWGTFVVSWKLQWGCP